MKTVEVGPLGEVGVLKLRPEAANYGPEEFAQLVQQLRKWKNDAKDYVVPSKLIRACVGNTHGDYEKEADGFELKFGVKRLPMTAWAQRQIAEKCGIPIRYFDRMRDEEKFNLLCENVNTWLIDDKKRLVRTLGGHVRAFLSDRYRVIDNLDLLLNTAQHFQDSGAKFHKVSISKTRLYIRAINPQTSFDLGKTKDGVHDVFHPGMVLRNSEVGDGALTAEPFVFRSVCSNGLVMGTKYLEGLRRIHIGARLDEGIYSGETISKENDTIFSKIRDLVTTVFDSEKFEKWVEDLQATIEVKPESVQETIEGVGVQFNLPDWQVRKIVDNVINDRTVPDEFVGTQFAVMNAVTMTAKEMDPETMYELEKVGGEIASMGEKDFLALEGLVE